MPINYANNLLFRASNAQCINARLPAEGDERGATMIKTYRYHSQIEAQWNDGRWIVEEVQWCTN